MRMSLTLRESDRQPPPDWRHATTGELRWAPNRKCGHHWRLAGYRRCLGQGLSRPELPGRRRRAFDQAVERRWRVDCRRRHPEPEDCRARDLRRRQALRPHRHASQQCRHLYRQAFHSVHCGRSANVLGVNVAGFFHITQRAIAEMEKQGSGHVVQITTSLVDHAIEDVPSVLASLSKGTQCRTNSLAIEYAKKGIRANAVAPGIIKSPMHPAEIRSSRRTASGRPHGRDVRHRQCRYLLGKGRVLNGGDPPRRRWPERRSLTCLQLQEQSHALR